MVKVLLDTNILIDYLNGIEKSRVFFRSLGEDHKPAISIITWMEVMIGTNAATRKDTELFLSTFEVIHLNAYIAAKAVELRQSEKIKLPDAIIRASAQINEMQLVTRNTKDFPNNNSNVLLPYTI